MDELVAVPGMPGTWRVADVEFVRSFTRDSTPRRFCIQKDQSMLDRYVDLAPEFRQGRIVELGIAAGGSTALLALLTSPTKLVACDFSLEPVTALAAFIEERALADTVRPFYGVNQNDQRKLAAIVDREFGTDALDLVVDDASHLWEQTLSSFEVLYPRLRPGGMFVIEDWTAQYLLAEEISDAMTAPTSDRYAELRARYDETMRDGGSPRPPLARLGIELLLAGSAAPDVIASVTVNQHWITVRRGPASLDRDRFRLAEHYTDHFGWLDDDPESQESWWYRRVWERSVPSPP